MDEITLETINNSIGQISNRIGDTNKSITSIKEENTVSHRDINKKVEKISKFISDIDKESSITKTMLLAHLDEHEKRDKQTNINGVNITSFIGNIISACIGAVVTLKVANII